MRKVLQLAGLSMVVALLFFQAAWAHPSPHGPHNHNNNAYMDLYKTQTTWWNGAFTTARQNYGDEETGGLNVAPLPQVVSSIDQADVEVIHQPCVDDGNSESFFMPRKAGPDLVSVGECVVQPVWVTTHELQHSYGFPHPVCEDINPDPAYLPEKRRSILCRARWDSGDLPRHDKRDLRNIPNQWPSDPHGFSASSVNESEGLPQGARPITKEKYDGLVPPRLQHVPASEGDYYIP